jgi:hypothetical protein
MSTTEILARLNGGTGEFTVTTGPSCSWTAASSADWIRLRQGAQGVGSGRVVYEVDSGEAVRPPTNYVYAVDFLRQASLTIRSSEPTAAYDVPVRQFPDCHTAFGTPSVTFDANGGRRHLFVLVESPFNCPWTMLPPTASWVETSGAPVSPQWQRGDGDLHLAISPNPSTSSRSMVLLVGERPLTIAQAGR